MYRENTKVGLLRTGIAWPSDKNIKYKNPPGNSLKEGMILIFNILYQFISFN